MMVNSGHQSLSDFYENVKVRNPLRAALLMEDVVTVALSSLAANKSNGQEAANRLRRNSLNLPELPYQMLEKALRELGYL